MKFEQICWGKKFSLLENKILSILRDMFNEIYQVINGVWIDLERIRGTLIKVSKALSGCSDIT